MTIEDFDRTEEENDNLGVTDMKTENYAGQEGDGAQNAPTS